MEHTDPFPCSQGRDHYPYPEPDGSSPLRHVIDLCLGSMLIFFYHLRQGFRSGRFPSGFRGGTDTSQIKLAVRIPCHRAEVLTQDL
jgi:hypothetical protein